MKRWLLIMVLLPAQASAGISRGPYLQDVRTDRITVAAETDDGSGCRLEWGHWGEGFGRSLPMEGEGDHREVTLEGLDASNCYNYRIVCGLRQSPDATFCTAPLPGESFSFVIMGDTRSNHDTHAAVAQAIRDEGVDFYINTGDLVSDGTSEEDWDHFFEAEKDLLLEIPFYPVVGNHDEEGGKIDIYSRLFAVPAGSGDERYYSFTYGNARFIILDNQSTWLGRPEDETDQGLWLASELESAASNPIVEHTFVLAHCNMYSAKEGRDGDEGLRHWREEMLETGVDWVFSGHDHHYVRGVADNGLPFTVTGGGGAPLYEVIPEYLTQGEPVEAENFGWLPEPDTNPYTIYYSLMTNHYIRVEINGPHFSAWAKQLDGQAFDSFTYGMVPKEPEQGCYCGSGEYSLTGLLLLVFLLMFRRLSNRTSRT
jgi:3',5'-cyclic AMP phosphodiesterase CpdA